MHGNDATQASELKPVVVHVHAEAESSRQTMVTSPTASVELREVIAVSPPADDAAADLPSSSPIHDSTREDALDVVPHDRDVIHTDAVIADGDGHLTPSVLPPDETTASIRHRACNRRPSPAWQH